jgi:hypothetical protein
MLIIWRWLTIPEIGSETIPSWNSDIASDYSHVGIQFTRDYTYTLSSTCFLIESSCEYSLERQRDVATTPHWRGMELEVPEGGCREFSAQSEPVTVFGWLAMVWSDYMGTSKRYRSATVYRYITWTIVWETLTALNRSRKTSIRRAGFYYPTGVRHDIGLNRLGWHEVRYKSIMKGSRKI